MDIKTAIDWIINSSGLTYNQMLGITIADVRTRFPNKDMSNTFIKHVLAFVRAYAQGQKDQFDLDTIKTQVTTWLDNNFPGNEIEKGRLNDKPYIKIWLEGK